jgi:hypothetical protein
MPNEVAVTGAIVRWLSSIVEEILKKKDLERVCEISVFHGSNRSILSSNNEGIEMELHTTFSTAVPDYLQKGTTAVVQATVPVICPLC